MTIVSAVAGYDLTVENKIFTDPEVDFASGFFRTAGRIYAENLTVQSSGRLTLRAREGIHIQGPFLAEAGSDFEMRIDDGPTLTELGIPGIYQPPPSTPMMAGGGQGPNQQQSETTSGEARTLSARTAGTSGVPEALTLTPNFPNPFRRQTTIRYGLPEAAHVRLVVYDALGRKVAVVIDAQQRAGYHRVTWKVGSLPSGTYLYSLEANSALKTGGMTVIR